MQTMFLGNISQNIRHWWDGRDWRLVYRESLLSTLRPLKNSEVRGDYCGRLTGELVVLLYFYSQNNPRTLLHTSYNVRTICGSFTYLNVQNLYLRQKEACPAFSCSFSLIISSSISFNLFSFSIVIVILVSVKYKMMMLTLDIW